MGDTGNKHWPGSISSNFSFEINEEVAPQSIRKSMGTEFK
jgi:hypothetical protein